MAHDKNGFQLASMPQCSMKPVHQTENHIVMDNGMHVRRWPKQHEDKAEMKRNRRDRQELPKAVNPRHQSPLAA